MRSMPTALAIAALMTSGGALACDAHASHDDTQASVAPPTRAATLPPAKRATLPAPKQAAAVKRAPADTKPLNVAKTANRDGG